MSLQRHYNPKPRYLPIPKKCPIHKCLNRKDFGEAADCRTFSMTATGWRESQWRVCR